MKASIVDPESAPLLSSRQHSPRRRAKLTTAALVLVVLATALLLATRAVDLWKHFTSRSHLTELERAKQCSIKSFRTDLSFLDNARPIEAEEFLQRRDKLANALVADGVDAFVLEPGYTFQYE